MELTTKNYEEIFVSIIEYIRDNPNCNHEDCTSYIYKKYSIKENDINDHYFVNTTIDRISHRNSYNDKGKSITKLGINPDALFYLMEYRELKHSLEESKQARKQATLSTWFAVAGIVISIIGLAVSIYYSNKQIEISEKQMNDTKTAVKK